MLSLEHEWEIESLGIHNIIVNVGKDESCNQHKFEEFMLIGGFKMRMPVGKNSIAKRVTFLVHSKRMFRFLYDKNMVFTLSQTIVKIKWNRVDTKSFQSG